MFGILIQWLFADWTGVLVQVFFAYTIILMIRDKQKPPVQTGILTGAALVLLSLGGSFLSSATALLGIANGFLWFVLAYQRYKQDR